MNSPLPDAPEAEADFSVSIILLYHLSMKYSNYFVIANLRRMVTFFKQKGNFENRVTMEATSGQFL